MKKIFLSCQKASELIEKKINFELSTVEGMQLSLHKLLCDACQRYEKQSLLLEKWIINKEKKAEDSALQITEKEIDELKEKILKSEK
ncbi:MAG: hypothetical protein EAZ08_10550 [Cytophagales bacterium]|nr:MAG: hypothetical protein EAZ08_10550 [Cytophagales bacterium]